MFHCRFTHVQIDAEAQSISKSGHLVIKLFRCLVTSEDKALVLSWVAVPELSSLTVEGTRARYS